MLFRGGVTHRIDLQRTQSSVALEFQGLLDTLALAELRAAIARAGATGSAVRVVLREGTEVDRACVAGLLALALEVEVEAESAYLARWLGRR